MLSPLRFVGRQQQGLCALSIETYKDFLARVILSHRNLETIFAICFLSGQCCAHYLQADQDRLRRHTIELILATDVRCSSAIARVSCTTASTLVWFISTTIKIDQHVFCLLVNQQTVHANKCLQMKHHFALMAMFGRMGNSNAFSQRYECMFIMASVSYSLVSFILAGTPKASSPAISGVQTPRRMATRCSLSSCRKQRKHVPS
jgi:hypothetical protein